jgi:WD40 repeat protein
MIPSQETNNFNFTEVNNSLNSSILNLPSALNGKLDSSAYAINFELASNNQTAFSCLSDFSLAVIDVETLKPTIHIPQAHNKKIMSIFIGEDRCFSCSNDGSVKIWDFNDKKPLVATLKTPSQAEVYSVGQAKHVVAGGGQGIIHFW